MSIPLDVLTASGHPNRSASQIGYALKVVDGTDKGEAYEKGPYLAKNREIRPWCIECSAGHVTEVRRCPIYDCPAWSRRMGRNPHDSRRGAAVGFAKPSRSEPDICDNSRDEAVFDG